MAKYSKKIVSEICDLIKADSYTIVEICQMVKISEDTYYTWKKQKPEFSESIKKAEEERRNFFIIEARKSLLKKIQGYTVDEKKTVYVDSGKVVSKKGSEDESKQTPKIKEQTVIKKHIQPDTVAIIFTLTNCDPDNWKNKQSNEITGKDGKDLFSGLTDEEIDKKIEELEKKSNS
ncbi:hypothetical protein CMU86_11685 [Elizabethkingia anophelis]|nr:hypothetical protein [Elizabethkingia anophelis]